MGDIKVKSWPNLYVRGVSGSEPVHIAVEPVSIQELQNIAPVAAHIKEVNHIDPLSIEALHISQVKNIEPLSIEKFNITDLPMVNMSLRELPPVDMNVRRLPPVSIGTHQNFHIPSNYTVRARILGIEFFRINVDGQTVIIPCERYRREQERTQNRSFPLTATAGNPAIPSRYSEESATTHYPVYYRPMPMQPNPGLRPIPHNTGYPQRANPVNIPSAYTGQSGSLNFGLPRMSPFAPQTSTPPPRTGMNLRMSGMRPPGTYGIGSVSSGG